MNKDEVSQYYNEQALADKKKRDDDNDNEEDEDAG